MDCHPLNPGIEIRGYFLGICDENLRAVPEALEVGEMSLIDERVHQRRTQLVELKENHRSVDRSVVASGCLSGRIQRTRGRPSGYGHLSTRMRAGNAGLPF
jgi:hypothetical protein